MASMVVLDSTPLGLVTQKPGRSSEVDSYLQWIADLTRSGWMIRVPEIADYEVRRELPRSGKTTGVARLDAFNNARVDRYIPLNTAAMRLAANLWAQVRTSGKPTADSQALDGDVILAAQVLTLEVDPSEIIVAAHNVKHISRFTAADLWMNINP